MILISNSTRVMQKKLLWIGLWIVLILCLVLIFVNNKNIQKSIQHFDRPTTTTSTRPTPIIPSIETGDQQENDTALTGDDVLEFEDENSELWNGILSGEVDASLISDTSEE